MNYTISNIPVLATQLNDTDLFEKADGPASGQSQRVTGAVMKQYFGSAIQSQTVVLDGSTTLYQVAHGLSSTPKILRAVFSCITSDINTGFNLGKEVNVESFIFVGTNGPTNLSVHCDATNVYLSLPGIALVGNEIQYKTDSHTGVGASGGTTPSSFNNFRLKFYYA